MNTIYEEKAVLPTVTPCPKTDTHLKNVTNPRDEAREAHVEAKEERYLNSFMQVDPLKNVLALPVKTWSTVKANVKTGTALVFVKEGVAENAAKLKVIRMYARKNLLPALRAA